jgi:hypothetical protein
MQLSMLFLLQAFKQPNYFDNSADGTICTGKTAGTLPSASIATEEGSQTLRLQQLLRSKSAN